MNETLRTTDDKFFFCRELHVCEWFVGGQVERIEEFGVDWKSVLGKVDCRMVAVALC